MSDNRLIFNARGETARVIEPLTLQISVDATATTNLRGAAMVCSELVLAPREAIALAAQLADAAGYAAEFTKVDDPPKPGRAQRTCYARHNALCTRQSECGWVHECAIVLEREREMVVPKRPETLVPQATIDAIRHAEREGGSVRINTSTGKIVPGKPGQAYTRDVYKPATQNKQRYTLRSNKNADEPFSVMDGERVVSSHASYGSAYYRMIEMNSQT